MLNIFLSPSGERVRERGATDVLCVPLSRLRYARHLGQSHVPLIDP